jgi:hypothetical protein
MNASQDKRVIDTSANVRPTGFTRDLRTGDNSQSREMGRILSLGQLSDSRPDPLKIFSGRNLKCTSLAAEKSNKR